MCRPCHAVYHHEHYAANKQRYIDQAKARKDALRLEEYLTGCGVDFHVETDKYKAGAVFRTERVGAFFYVAPDDDEAARTAMRQGGFTPFIA